MLKEIDVGGIYLAPFGVCVVVAFLLFLPLRAVFDRIRIQRFVWHRPLFDLATFIVVLCLIGLLL